ncbi:MAG: hypothetical protein AAB649_07585 [Patescibacteria group bacterium]
MKQFGTEGKKRFSLKYGEGNVVRFGTCDPNDDERMDIVRDELGQFFLVQYQKGATGYAEPPKQRTKLPEDVLATNGYYDHEHDGWRELQDFLDQTM